MAKGAQCSLVHDIHPNDAFILVPDAPHPPSDHESSPIMSHDTGDSSGEPCKLLFYASKNIVLILLISPRTSRSIMCTVRSFIYSHLRVLSSPLLSCLLPIVGARFHCAICDSVDICSNCEAAGLPGNLDSANGGHNSSHILIKVCFRPLFELTSYSSYFSL